jgi:hypothetical protein
MPEDAPIETRTTPLGDSDEVVAQQNVGKDNMAGGGEWPDPHRPSAQPGTGGED